MFNATEYRAELNTLRALIVANASALDCAAFINGARQSMALSQFVEDLAMPGTLAEQIFNVLCGE